MRPRFTEAELHDLATHPPEQWAAKASYRNGAGVERNVAVCRAMSVTTYAKAGAPFGLSRERVRQIGAKARRLLDRRAENAVAVIVQRGEARAMIQTLRCFNPGSPGSS